jgi:hypothetical protein
MFKSMMHRKCASTGSTLRKMDNKRVEMSPALLYLRVVEGWTEGMFESITQKKVSFNRWYIDKNGQQEG